MDSPTQKRFSARFIFEFQFQLEDGEIDVRHTSFKGCAADDLRRRESGEL